MNTIVKAGSAAEFLTLVPRMLGFRPTRSIVAIPFAGARSVGALRFDLPETDVEAAAATFLGLVCRIPDAATVAWVVYTDEPFAPEKDDGLPHRDLLTAIERCSDACGLRIHDALCVASDAWGSYLDPACPPAGWPLSPFLHARADVHDQFSGAELPSADPAEVAAHAAAAASLDAALRALGGERSDSAFGRAASEASLARIDPQALAAAVALDDLPAFFEDVLCAVRGSSGRYETALLAWCFARPMLRDVALSQWCLGFAAGDELLDAQLRSSDGDEYPSHLAVHMWGEGERPDPVRLAAALETVRQVAAVATADARAGALAIAAWISWALGRSTHADHYARLALEAVPEHGLAEIVRSFVSAGHLPNWAFRADAA